MMGWLQNPSTTNKIVIALICAVLLYSLCIVIVQVWGGLADWTIYRRAIAHMLQNYNPYYLPGRYQFYNPPWVLILMLPFFIFPPPYDAAALMVATLVGVTYASHKMGGRIWGTILLLTCPPIVACFLCGQIDWLVLLGLVLPPQYGLFLVVIKPQVGAVVALYWFIRTWQTQGLDGVIDTFGPVVCGYLLSFLWFGLWPLRWITLSQQETQLPLTFWPFGITFGLYLAYRAIQRHNVNDAVYAAPFLSSHVRVYSWAGCFLTLVTEPKLLALMSISMWIILLICQVEV